MGFALPHSPRMKSDSWDSWSWGDDGKHRIPHLLVARTKRIVDANWSGSVSSVPPSIGGIFSREGFWIKSLC